MRMTTAQYLRARARAILEGSAMPAPLTDDWRIYVDLVRPMGGEWLDPDVFSDEMHCLRLCLAAAIAEADC